MTRLLGVIGYPLKHTISPLFQQAALDYCELDVNYDKWPLTTDELPAFINELRKPEYLGANVTIPYKEVVLNMLDSVDEQARICGSVNTILNHNGILKGFNTDVNGFLMSFKDVPDIHLSGINTAIIGAGGAAAAVALALVQQSVSSVHIFNRNKKRALSIIDKMNEYLKKKEQAVSLECHDLALPVVSEMLKDCALIVNCTPVGMKYTQDENKSILLEEQIPSNAIVFDLVYNPRETLLLQMANKKGAKTIYGLPMLIFQGAESFRIWTKQEPPVEIMFEVARKALREVNSSEK